MKFMKHLFPAILFILIVLTGCNNKDLYQSETSNLKNDKLYLTFTGDIMAHDVNFRQKNFGKMYEEISPLLTGDDLTFGNLEFPIDNTQPYSTFPYFNVNTPYVEAVIESGFDVFSLANNHSNDKGNGGVLQTLISMESLKDKYRRIIYNGIKESYFDGFEVSVFYKKGYKIAFLSVTEILNAYNNSRWKVQYYDYTDPMKKEFTEKIKKIRKEINPDLFIISIHVNEPEYVRTTKESRKNYFRELADSGADIIWAHHPHVAQEWELYTPRERKGRALIMYSMGNFISGQRYRVNINAPEEKREYTGDSIIIRAELERTPEGTGFLIKPEPVLITTKVDYNTKEITLHSFTRDFVENQDEYWQPYYKKRFNLMKAQFGNLFPWEEISD